MDDEENKSGDGEEKKEEVKQEDKIPVDSEPEVTLTCILTKSDIEGGVSNLQRTPDSSTYAFASLDASNKRVEDLVDSNPGEATGTCPLEQYQFIRNVNLNGNCLTAIDKVKGLTYLYQLQASGNQIKNIDFMCESKNVLRFLSEVDLSKNKLEILPQIVCPCITKLVLDNNEIKEMNFKSHPTLKSLSLNKNKLSNGEGLKFHHHLEELSIQENETLTSLKGLKGLPGLKKLNLTGSKIEVLDDFPSLPHLEELILDKNPIANMDEIVKLNHLTSLKKISFIETPLAEEKGEELRKEILVALTDKINGFTEVNGEPVDEDLLKDAKETRETRIAEAIEAKKQAEEAAREAELAKQNEGAEEQ